MHTLLVDGTVKISLLLAGALGAVTLLGGRSAAVRHWVLAAAFFCAAAMPSLQLILPAWRLDAGALASPTSRHENGQLIALEATDTPPGRSAVSAPQAARAQGLSAVQMLGVAWMAGAAVNLLILLAGFARVTRVASSARPVRSGPWFDLANEIRLQYGMRRPVRVLQSHHPALLGTWGIIRPAVLLPHGAASWDIDRIRIVLSHELAHVRRRDWLVQMAADLLRAVYWFDPLLWLACGRLRRESEQAVDDAVLRRGVGASEYATALVDIARDLARADGLWSPALAMARPSTLEGRVTAMLNTRLNRDPLSRSACAMAAVAIMGITMALAGFAVSAQSAFSTFSGNITDVTGRVVPNVTVSVANTDNKEQRHIATDARGHFEFVGLPPGTYQLQAVFPGFKRVRGTLAVSGENVQHDIALQLGSIEETLSVRDGARLVVDERHSYARGDDPCAHSGAGGCIMQPVKIRDARPPFPGPAGTVILNGHIDTQGLVRDLEVVGAADPGLASAAIGAVSQWEFAATHLDGVPVETDIRVNINFMAAR
jgi:beta-lactamase regulating signal transducer with metallopeptidase domain